LSGRGYSSGRRTGDGRYVGLIVGVIRRSIGIIQVLTDAVDASPARAADNRPMQASPNRIAVIFCAGIAVVAFPGADTASGLGIASV